MGEVQGKREIKWRKCRGKERKMEFKGKSLGSGTKKKYKSKNQE
jgi:hypothetical protein